jgi:hypothetical protein
MYKKRFVEQQSLWEKQGDKNFTEEKRPRRKFTG